MQSIPNDLLENWNVLIVDDQPDNLEIAEVILSTYGAIVHTASNGKEGLEVLQTMKPHFIISDLSMPEMDGWEFIARLQKDRGLAEIPAIALTAHTNSGFRERAIAAGFHNYLTKPFIIETFVKDLVRLLLTVPEFDDLLMARS